VKSVNRTSEFCLAGRFFNLRQGGRPSDFSMQWRRGQSQAHPRSRPKQLSYERSGCTPRIRGQAQIRRKAGCSSMRTGPKIRQNTLGTSRQWRLIYSRSPQRASISTASSQCCLSMTSLKIDVGDTFAYDATGQEDKFHKEFKAADPIFGILPKETGEYLRGLWEEYELGGTPDAARTRSTASPYTSQLPHERPLLASTWGYAVASPGTERHHRARLSVPLGVVLQIVEDAVAKGDA
jgi:HD domain